MRLQVRSWVAVLGGLLLLPALSRAQCPTAASCTPGAASQPGSITSIYRMGIYNVMLGSINNTTPGYSDGYKDYSCTLNTNLTVGTAASITVVNGTQVPESIRVWIDYNNDGTFAATELAYASDRKLSHTGTITPPAGATLGTRLRMRIASDNADDASLITPCSTPKFSQDEDYSVTLVAATIAPVAAFTTNGTTTCTGCVQFTDRSTNAPTSWLWDFGDNTTSTQQNPQHCYTMAGTYQVTLQATNAIGSNTTAATTITYNTVVPVASATACPGSAANNPLTGYGITRVRLGTLDNSSADGTAGYQDFTCTQRVSLMLGSTYTLNITTGGTNAHDTRAWLDLNNDGTFTASEKVFEVLNSAAPSASFVVPTGTTVLNQPLRLRIVADGFGTDPQPCRAPQLGQVEDYTVTVTPNTSPPVAAFTSNYVAGACSSSNTYTFTDQSTNGPTAWLWTFSPSTGVTFVNGTSATSQNPQVAFSTSGYYSVTLRATNANGSNVITRTNYLLVQVPCLTYCAANGGPSMANPNSAVLISNVALTAGSGGTAYSNSSPTTSQGANGYTYFSTPPISLTPNGTQTITVTTNVTLTHRTSIWIDYNRDGVFGGTGATNELVYSGTVINTTTASAPIAVPATLGVTRMRVLVALDNATPNPCAQYYGQGEVEDYVVMPTVLATQQALALAALTVSPNPTPDGDLQVHLSDATQAGRYEVVVENPLGAQLLRQSLQLSAGQPAALSLAQLPAGLYLVRLTNAQGQTAMRRIVRQ